MRTFLATHWKSIVALILLVLLALITMSPGTANAGLATRIRQHAAASASGGHNTASTAALERARAASRLN